MSKKAKILGITWTQPRYYKGRLQMFQEDVKEAIKKVEEIQKKVRRI